MNISKIKIVSKFLFGGGIAGVVEYILDLFNDMIAKLPKDEVAKYAQLAKDVANFVRNLATTLIKNEEKRNAAIKTADAFDLLATSLLDATIKADELDAIIEAVKIAIEAWKAAK